MAARTPYCTAGTGAGDDLDVEIFRSFMGIMHRQRQLMFRIFAKHGLHPTQSFCIRILATQGETTQSELADALLLSRPTVTRLLQRLERAGLVARRPGEADQRRTLVALTAAGFEVHRTMGEAMAELIAVTLARLPVEDRENLARILPAWSHLVDEAVT